MGKIQRLVRETNTSVVSFYEHLDFEVAPETFMAMWLQHTAQIRFHRRIARATSTSDTT